jgi:hypothetical protein
MVRSPSSSVFGNVLYSYTGAPGLCRGRFFLKKACGVGKYVMLTFLEFLVLETRTDLVPRHAIEGYEREFHEQLKRLIRRVQDPKLRTKLEAMLDCPIIDSQGQCRGFAEYALAALVRSGIHTRFDIEAALAYIMEKMLVDRGETAKPRIALFGGFQERPGPLQGNPLQARFLTFLHFAIRNIRSGRIPRLANVVQKHRGTFPDEIAATPSTDADLGELVADIIDLLRRKEHAEGLPLVAIFRAMMAGLKTMELRARFGDRKSRKAKAVIEQTVEEYAERSGNYALLNLLRRGMTGHASQRDFAGGRST